MRHQAVHPSYQSLRAGGQSLADPHIRTSNGRLEFRLAVGSRRPLSHTSTQRRNVPSSGVVWLGLVCIVPYRCSTLGRTDGKRKELSSGLHFPSQNIIQHFHLGLLDSTLALPKTVLAQD